MPKFFVGPQAVQGDSAFLTGDAAAHAKVLRLSCGDEVTLCTGDGTDWRCSVRALHSGQIDLNVLACVPSSSEPQMQVRVYMAYAKSDKLEHVIQKATELGASEIVAFPSSRCVSRPDGASLPKKLERWRKIAASAAEQSGRGKIPEVLTADSFEKALEQAAGADFAAFLYENESHLSLRSAFAAGTYRTASLVTGPEGGFTEEEAALAAEKGLRVCTLGPRILRCETAPLCALTAMLFAAGELD